MLTAKVVVGALRKCGVSHVVGLPDNSSAALLQLVSAEPAMRLISVTREGEAFAVAAGLWIGGATPAVVIQNTGFLESGDSFRGTVQRMRIPLLCLITFRGYRTLMRAGGDSAVSPDIDILSRAEVDSTAVVTVPTLRAWGLPFSYLSDDSEIARVPECFEQAARESRPVALLVTETLMKCTDSRDAD